MNWLAWTLKILAMVPSVVVGVEQVVQGAKQGAAKKDLALASLGLANATASAVVPEHQQAIDAATKLASSAIDNTVALMNAIQHPDFKPTDAAVSASAPAPVVAAPAEVKVVSVLAPGTTAPHGTEKAVAHIQESAAAIEAQVAQPAPLVEPDNVQAHLNGPGLHNVVPA